MSETAQQHLAAFVERLKVLRYSPATLASREQSLRKFFHWLGESADVRDVSKQTVRDFQEWLLGRYATNTAHVHLISLRRFFEHLEKTDALLVNPCEGVPLPKMEDRLPRNILTPEEVKRILDAPDVKTKKGIRDRAILEVFYSTGIRLEEMSRLTVHDVDLSGYVRVNRGKGAKDRVVPLGVTAADSVREYLERVRIEWAKDNPDERALWLSWRWPHQPIKKQIIAVTLRQYAKTTGLTKSASPHVWRHTCATHLVSNGANIAYRDRTILETFYATGIRKSELMNLTVNDVNLEEELLRINGGKFAKDRVVPLTRAACSFLETYLKAIRPALLQGRVSDRVFISQRAAPLSKNALGELVEKYARIAGVNKHVTCHIWRHSCATHLVKNKASLRHVQELLGHRDLSTTERYLHLTIADLKEAHRQCHPREKEMES